MTDIGPGIYPDMGDGPAAIVGAKLDELRDLIDSIDDLNQSLGQLKKQRRAIESQLERAAKDAGVESFSSDRLSVTVKDDTVVAYEPDLWNELVAWAVETGNHHVIQRRVSTKPILELIDNGVELPAGVRLETITKVNVRRK